MPQRNEAAGRLLGILAGQQVDGPVAQVLDAALAEERRLGVQACIDHGHYPSIEYYDEPSR